MKSWRERVSDLSGPVLWVDAACQVSTWQALQNMALGLQQRLPYTLVWASSVGSPVTSLADNALSVITHSVMSDLALQAQIYLCDDRAAWLAQANQWPHLVAVIVTVVPDDEAQDAPQFISQERIVFWPVAARNSAIAWSQALFFVLQTPEVRALILGVSNRRANTHTGVWRVQGPHRSSYSLALVNRSLALGLRNCGLISSLWEPRLNAAATIGIAEASASIEQEVLAELRDRGIQRAHGSLVDEVVLYNDYPVNVWQLSAAVTKVLANYAWEESSYPLAWVHDMNAQLDLITVVTPLVKKILRNQGVRVPIAVVGNAVNHWHSVQATPVDLSDATGFRFLHVSSGLARKGVDVLLKAYSQAFRVQDPVSLIIKTVGNPDNQCARLLAQHQAADPLFPRVILIDEDWHEGQMKSLYSQVQAVVMPSRAEGFGLPAAEAIWQGVPVITTGFGGQVSLTARAAMALIDYDFAPSGSHLDLMDSVWVEPRVDHLASLMSAWASAPPALLQQIAAQAQASYAYPESWKDVAQLTQMAVTTVRERALPALPKIAWVSSWNSPCGIATYSENLARAFARERLLIYANRDAQALEADGSGVTRAWVRGQDSYPDLLGAIEAQGARVAIIQSQPGLMPLTGLCHLLAGLQAQGVATHVTLHNTQDWFGSRSPALTAHQRAAFAKATRLFVHTVDDLNRLKQWGLVENVVFFPHGIYDSPLPKEITPRSHWQIPATSPVIATFGFLMPHKGQQVLLDALARLPAPYDETHLLMLNTVFAQPSSQMEWQACQQKIQALGLKDRVHVETQFLAERVALRHLAAADAIVFPYQYTEESASGAVRMGLATRQAVAVTPLAIFEDVSKATYVFSGTDVTAISQGLVDLLSQQASLGATASYRQEAERLLAAKDWRMLSERLKNLVEGEYLDVFSDKILV